MLIATNLLEIHKKKIKRKHVRSNFEERTKKEKLFLVHKNINQVNDPRTTKHKALFLKILITGKPRLQT